MTNASKGAVAIFAAVLVASNACKVRVTESRALAAEDATGIATLVKAMKTNPAAMQAVLEFVERYDSDPTASYGLCISAGQAPYDCKQYHQPKC